MNNTPLVILLPGLDGTGVLFNRLIEHFPQSLAWRCFSADAFDSEKLSEQAQYVVDELADRPCIIFAESFSGRLAYEILNNPQSRVLHVVFAASFLQRPSFLSRFATWLPLWPLYRGLLPNWLLNKILFGECAADPMLLSLFSQALAKAPEQRIKMRLAAVATMAPAIQPFAVPCTYVRADADYLVNSAAGRHIAALSSQFSLIELQGGHFIAQCQPAACAELLQTLVINYSKPI